MIPFKYLLVGFENVPFLLAYEGYEKYSLEHFHCVI